MTSVTREVVFIKDSYELTFEFWEADMALRISTMAFGQKRYMLKFFMYPWGVREDVSSIRILTKDAMVEEKLTNYIGDCVSKILYLHEDGFFTYPIADSTKSIISDKSFVNFVVRQLKDFVLKNIVEQV